MKLLSICVGRPRVVEYNGEPDATAIFKLPVAGKVAVGQFNVAGDEQADLRYHGGWSKAVYAYPAAHYDLWRAEMPETDLPFGAFGENLTVDGMLETAVCIGDKFKIGTAEFVVTEPRFPCYKLGLRLNRKDVIKKMQKTRRNGFYLAVAQTGEIEAGDEIEWTHRDDAQFSIADALRLHDDKTGDKAKLQKALEIEALPDEWKRRIRKFLQIG